MSKVFDLSMLRINPQNPFPFSGSDTEWNDFKKKLDRDPEFLEANKIAYDSSRDNLVIAGNKRVQGLRELGWKTIPAKYVIDCKDWSEEKRERYIYASNWNIGQWSVEFTDEEQAEEWGITFEEEEEIHLEAKEDDYAPPAEIRTDIVKGDLFELKKGDLCHRLLCGDSTDSDTVAKLMNGNKVDMVFTDPPYGISVVKNDKVGADFGVAKKGKYSEVIADDTTETAKDFYNTCISLDMDKFIIWGGNYFTDFLPSSDGWLIWNKRAGTDIRNTFADGEMAWCSFHTPVRIYDQLWNGMIREGEKDKRVHPTQKPIRMLSEIIQDHIKGVNIFDGFLGSASTMVASHQLERNCYGIEIDEKYCQVGIDRMLKLDEDIQLFRNGTDVTEKYRKRLLASEKQA